MHMVCFGSVDIDLAFKDSVVPQCEDLFPVLQVHGKTARTWFNIVGNKFNNSRKGIRKL